MSSDTDVRYSAEISLSAHSHVPMECMSINGTQYVCQTVEKSDTPRHFPQSTVGVSVCVVILVLVFAVMGGFSTIGRGFRNLRSKKHRA